MFSLLILFVLRNNERKSRGNRRFSRIQGRIQKQSSRRDPETVQNVFTIRLHSIRNQSSCGD